MAVSDPESGFSLVELLVSLAIFVIISGAVFGLLNQAQIRVRAEQNQLESLEPARTGIDQVTRDIHNAGFPAQNSYQGAVSALLTAIPFVGMDTRVHINQNCTVNGGTTPCVIPGPFDLALENLQSGVVEWTYYQVRLPSAGSTTCTLYRAVSPKSMSSVPTAGIETPLVEQIVNTPIGSCSLTFGQPVFTYTCSGGSPCNAQNISQVAIAEEVITLEPDIQTRQYGLATFEGIALRINPPM